MFRLISKIIFKINGMEFLYECDKWYGILSNSQKWSNINHWAIRNCGYLDTVKFFF